MKITEAQMVDRDGGERLRNSDSSQTGDGRPWAIWGCDSDCVIAHSIRSALRSGQRDATAHILTLDASTGIVDVSCRGACTDGSVATVYRIYVGEVPCTIAILY